ncbi:hypothetical protein D7Y15_43495 [Corallococcus sp. AB030]|nr:hypothetical protein D7Y15_43495 [Corallococcus sp. AB030]
MWRRRREEPEAWPRRAAASPDPRWGWGARREEPEAGHPRGRWWEPKADGPREPRAESPGSGAAWSARPRAREPRAAASAWTRCSAPTAAWRGASRAKRSRWAERPVRCEASTREPRKASPRPRPASWWWAGRWRAPREASPRPRPASWWWAGPWRAPGAESLRPRPESR